ncbi:hypothetical protein PDL07_08350 [Bacillus cereus]|uniref:hypothetical protein n=1 Tax=Bacillus cereus group TaxID=86661 RepID=UPI002AC1675C|nr:hypothetical protein [Bacillus cereus]MDA1782687.1 hypothetical protein [Bacillus cereus]MDZ4537937.1 hypothetical protein [Bacillus cereus]
MNIDIEEAYNIEENSILNGMYLVIIIHELGECTVEELAMTLYLCRFPNITKYFLSENDKNGYLNLYSDTEMNNLDNVFLTSFLIGKYSTRFIRGLKEIISRDMIKIDEQVIRLTENVDAGMLVLNDKNVSNIQKKVRYIERIINENSIDIINTRIEKIVGDR